MLLSKLLQTKTLIMLTPFHLRGDLLEHLLSGRGRGFDSSYASRKGKENLKLSVIFKDVG